MTSPGLCAGCEHVRVVTSARGSAFYLCRYSEVDARFPKYPRLPVLQCSAFTPGHSPSSSSSSES